MIPCANCEGSPAAKRRWCRICERVGLKKNWPMGFGDALIGPRGTLHHQKEDGSEATVCGLDATRDGWLWPE
jgi:hypothetical protein